MLSERALVPELLDAPQTDAALVERSLRFMRWVNHYLGGVSMVRRHIAAEASRVDGPLRVLDVGTGSADIPLAVSRWARHRGLAVEFTCIESNPQCAAIARRRLDQAADPAVRLVVGDVCRHDPAAPYHCAVGSMVFHHFDDDGILRLISHLRERVTGSLLINDLRRCWPNYLACGMLAPVLSPGVRHDALLSIRRGFRVAELRRLLGRVPRATVSVARAWFFRVQAVIRFDESLAPDSGKPASVLNRPRPRRRPRPRILFHLGCGRPVAHRTCRRSTAETGLLSRCLGSGHPTRRRTNPRTRTTTRTRKSTCHYRESCSFGEGSST